MIDFETELRDQLARAADAAPSGGDLLPAIERRVVRADRRDIVARATAVVVVLGLAAGAAVALTARDDGDTTTTAAEASSADTSTTTEAGATTTAPLATGWAATAPAPIDGRTMAATARVGDRIFVWGGMPVPGGEPVQYRTDGALYDPAADTWQTIAPSPLPAGPARAVAMGDEVLVHSNGELQDRGETGPAAAAAYDPATDTWRELAAPPDDVIVYAPPAWTGEEVVAVGTDVDGIGLTAALATVYDPDTDSWTAGTETDAVYPAAVAWTGTEVVVVGGMNSDPTDDAEDEVVVRAYNPADDAWRSIPWGLTPGSRTQMVVTWTGDRLLVGGGLTFDGDEMVQSREAALLDPATGTWTPTAAAPVGIFSPMRELAPVTDDGRIVVLAGSAEGLPTLGVGTSAPVTYDPATDTWASGPARPGDLAYGAAETWVAGRVVVTFGSTDAGASAAPTATFVP